MTAAQRQKEEGGLVHAVFLILALGPARYLMIGHAFKNHFLPEAKHILQMKSGEEEGRVSEL